MAELWQVIYLSGIPASGKTSLTDYLEQHIKPLTTYRYSELLRSYLSSRYNQKIAHSDLRSQSSTIVTTEDINHIDSRLIEEVDKNRNNSHVIIDSHAVTKEEFGFRITAFSKSLLEKLKFKMIFILYCDPSTIISRIEKNSNGRPLLTPNEINVFHYYVATLAINYGILSSATVYLLDSSKDIEELAKLVFEKLYKKNKKTEWIT